jgi:TolA-binding protein
MSESSDFPDSFDPNEHFSPKEPFDPADHLEGLSDQPFEPLADEHTPPPLDIADHGMHAAKSEPVEPSYGTYVPSSSGKLTHPSPFPGIATALLAGSLLLGSAIGISFVAGRQLGPAPTPETATPATTTDATKPVAEETKTADTHVDAIKTDVDGLSKRLDELQTQIATMPKPAPAPDLAPLSAKVDAIAKRLDTVPAGDTKGIEEKIEKVSSGQTGLIAKLDAVTAKAGNLEKALAAETSTVAALQAKVKSLSESKPKPETAAAVPAVNTDADFAKAVDLFKKSQFAQAKELFTKLEQASPNDARVWYYAAMANGFATNQWTGETETLVNKAMSLEKAGTPDLAKINATFSDLDAGAKGWLDNYRNRIVR